MSKSLRRALLYGSAAPILGALLWLRFGYEAPADFLQLLRGVDAQLRLAHGIPAHDRDGQAVAAHVELLDAASCDLELARQQEPDSPLLLEFDGFLWHLRGNPREAAKCYRRARLMPDCSIEQRDVLAFNEARMQALAGARVEALELLEGAQTEFAAAYQIPCLLERSELLHALARDGEAKKLLEQVRAADAPVAWIAAGRLYASMGDIEAAESALVAAAVRVPIADAHLALLKLAKGDADSCWQLLERAARLAPAEMRRLLREEPTAWQAIADDARFLRLTEPMSATPGR